MPLGKADKSTAIVIDPQKKISIDFKELWEYRDLVFFLSKRDITVRYKQTVLGFTWAIVQPVFSMIIYTIFFGNLAKLPSDGVPYPIFSFSALVPWQYFSSALTQASNSMVTNSNLFTKVYVPRITIPLIGLISPLVDFFIAFIILLGMMIFYHIPLIWNMLWLPIFLLLSIVIALGTSLWLSALNVQYRDVRYAIPFLIQLWTYASPIIYSINIIPKRWQLLFQLNPMVGVIEGFRWCLLGTHSFSGSMVFLSVLVSFLIILSGFIYFQSVEKKFADVV